MTLNEKKERLLKKESIAINKRIAMVAALKTAFVVLAIIYSVAVIFTLAYLGNSYYKTNDKIKSLNESIRILKTENEKLKEKILISDNEISNISKTLAIKNNQLHEAKKEIDILNKRIPIHKVETKSNKYNFEPYFYAMQSTKFNKYYLSEKEMTTVMDWSYKYGIDPNLVLGIMWVESRYYPNAKSKSSTASGYGQFIKSTGKWTHEYLLKRKDEYNHNVYPFNPDYAIPMMCAYLDHLIKISKGDIRKVLIRYNGNELGAKYYQLIDDYFAKVSSDIDLDSIEKNIKINYKLL